VIWLALALVVVQEYRRLSQGGSAREAT
jgi:hypothetical protein